jgi:hypothetical protein
MVITIQNHTREKEKTSPRIRVAGVWTPQHSPYKTNRPDITANFRNTGWNWNDEKKCYENWMFQRGVIDMSTFIFTTLETARGAHNVCFGNYESYLIAVNYSPNA